MIEKTIGFIGGGRIVRIMLEGFRRKKQEFKVVTISDINPETLSRLREKFPEIKISPNENQQPASKDIVFIALHPPVIVSILDEIKTFIKPDSALISLAPKITISKMTEHLDGFTRIIRMIPNACAIVNVGYNPIAFSHAFDEPEKKDLLNILTSLGHCPLVEEEKLEAYAILAAMGPTYFWFQLHELEKIGNSFGLTSQEAKDTVFRMGTGTVNTLYSSGISPEEVMDLIPVKPLGEEEENIRHIYRSRLETLFKKLKG